MWSSSRSNHLKKGFVLPLTLILLTFGSIMVFVAGLHVTRTVDKIHSYSIVADQQNISSNVVSASTFIYLQDPTDLFEDTWSGINEFRNFVTTRGGVEGDYWKDLFEEEDLENKNCLDLSGELEEDYKALPGFGEGKYDLGAFVYPVDNKKVIIGVSNRNGRKRYSVGLVSNIARPSLVLPAIRTAFLDRILKNKQNSNPGQGQGNNSVDFDFIYGNAVILDDVNLNVTAPGTAGSIIYPSLEAFSANVNGSPVGDESDWFSATSTENVSTVVDGWKEEYLSTLPDASTTAYMNNKNTWPTTFDSDTLYIIDATNTTEPSYYIDFDENGMHITQTDDDGDLIGHTLTIPSETALSSKINLQINGDVTIGDDNHKISKVTGEYSLTVYGDIEVNTNLVYNDIYQYVNNGNGESKVSNHPLDITKELITDMMDDNINDSLDLVSIGGNAAMKYVQGGAGKPTHGVKYLTGNLMAFKDDINDDGTETGGNISFPDLDDVIRGNNVSQFFTFGSVTANTFDFDGDAKDLLNSLILVSNNKESNSSATTATELQLVGMRTW